MNLYDKEQTENGSMIYPSKFSDKNKKEEKIPTVVTDDDISHTSQDLVEYQTDKATQKIWQM